MATSERDLQAAAIADAKRIGHSYIDILNHRNLDEFDNLLADHFVSHLRVGEIPGIAGFKAMMEQCYDAFPDIVWTAEEWICAPDRAVLRYVFEATHRAPFLGIPASGQFVRLEGAEVLHLSHGRIHEIWNYTDFMGLAARLNFVNPLALDF